MSRRVYLVRVGIDSTRSAALDCGGWNSPVNAETGEYVYVPLMQSWPELRARSELRRGYRELLPVLDRFRTSNGDVRSAHLPERLHGAEMHLDPDFEHLTYGDCATPRGTRISRFGPRDWMVFFSGFRPVQRSAELHYAIFGKYEVESICAASAIADRDSHINAHTRPAVRLGGDVVIRARGVVSGRLRRCILIGELRGQPRRMYRVTHSLLESWGGIHSNDGYIQRGSPFELAKPERFIHWWSGLEAELVSTNWD